eukprot:scaffold10985_cov129-Isochrysis_galbana.AAC.2
MANDNLALSKRPRNIPTHNETVCASIAAARAPQAASPSLHIIRRQNLPAHTIPEPTTLRRLMLCDVQRCLRVLSGARYQQSSEGMGSSPAATQKSELRVKGVRGVRARGRPR